MTGKVQQSRKRNSTLPLHLGVIAIEKEAFRSPSNMVANFIAKIISLFLRLFLMVCQPSWVIYNYPSIPFPVQNGSSSVQNGKIIISINIKKAAKRQYGGPVVMVDDNAPCHSNIEEVFSEEKFLGCEVLRLGPYSPMFNPIEQVCSLIKAYVKQELAAKIVSILAMERRDGLSITEQRASALTSLIGEWLHQKYAIVSSLEFNLKFLQV